MPSCHSLDLEITNVKPVLQTGCTESEINQAGRVQILDPVFLKFPQFYENSILNHRSTLLWRA